MKGLFPWTVGLAIGLLGVTDTVWGQLPITVEMGDDGTQTIVSPDPDTPGQYNIHGGTPAGINLFHSFEQFGLSKGEIANFLSSSDSDIDIENIVGRVMGGDASFIDGVLRVTGGDSNLFLMNPAGVIFGENARLNVPADFSVTTANAIGIDQDWFRSLGSNNYDSLSGIPDSFAFTTEVPGAIANTGNLSVGVGQQIRLIGGLIVNTGTLSTSGGGITVEAVPEEGLVTVTQEGNLLSLGLPVATESAVNNGQQVLVEPQSLPQLLSSAETGNVTSISTDGNIVKLTDSDTVIPSDSGVAVISGSLNAIEPDSESISGIITISGNMLELVSPNLASSDLVPDSRENLGYSIAFRSADGITIRSLQEQSSDSALSSIGNLSFEADTDNDDIGDFFVEEDNEARRISISTENGNISISGVNIAADNISTRYSNIALPDSLGDGEDLPGSIKILGSGDIKVGNLFNEGTIKIETPGNITVETIEAANSGINFSTTSPVVSINAGGFFRATEAFLALRNNPEDSGEFGAGGQYYELTSILAFNGVNRSDSGEDISIQHGAEKFVVGPVYAVEDEDFIYRIFNRDDSQIGRNPILESYGDFVFFEDGVFVDEQGNSVSESVIVEASLAQIDNASSNSFTAGAISLNDGNEAIGTSQNNRVLTGAELTSVGSIDITSNFRPFSVEGNEPNEADLFEDTELLVLEQDSETPCVTVDNGDACLTDSGSENVLDISDDLIN